MINIMLCAITGAALLFSTPLLAKKRYTVPPLDQVMLHMGQKTIKSLDQAVDQELDPTEINIFVWNMYKGAIPTWKKDFVRLTKFFDVLLLQEMWMDGAMNEAITKDETFSYHMATSFLDTKRSNTASGVAIASFVEPVKTFFQRSKYREPFIRTPKMALFADFALKGMTKKLRVATIHAINFVSKKKHRHQLRKMFEGLKDHTGPIVLGGDFNTWSKKKLRAMRSMARNAGLTEVKFKKWGSKRMHMFGNILDHIWVRGVNVIDTHVFYKIKSSDHKAMSVRISIN